MASMERDPKRRKVYDELSEDGPLTQEDVKYFRKQAIWRQMKYYRAKHQENEKMLAGQQAQVNDMRRRLYELKSWKRGLVNRLKLDVPRVKKEHKEVKNEDTDMDHDETEDDFDDEALILKLNDIVSSGISESDKQRFLEFTESVNELEQVNKENEVLRQVNEELRIKLDETTSNLFKKVERESSESVNRVYNNGTHSDESNNNNGSNSNGSSDQQTQPNGASSDHNNEESKETVDIEEVKYLKGVIAEYDNKFKQIVAEREKLASEMTKSVEVVKVEIPLNNIKNDEEVIEKNKLIKQLTQKLETYSALVNEEIKQENVQLKEQLSKNENDLVRIRNTRDDLLNKVNLLEKQKTNDALIKINEDLLQKMKYCEQGENATSEQEIIRELEESYKKLVSEITVKIMSKVDQDNLIKKYQIEKTKADQKYFQIMKLKDNLVNENKIMKLTLNKSNELIEKNQDLEKIHNEKLQQLQDINSEFKEIINKLSYNNKKLNEETNFKLIEINKLINKINELNQQVKDKSQVEVNLTNSLNGKDLELIKLTKFKQKVLSQTNGQGNGLNSLNDNEEELQGYRSMVKCSVCSKNWKDTALTVCGHVFCQQCTRERLNARLRRCPTCNRGFSANDLLSIHL